MHLKIYQYLSWQGIPSGETKSKKRKRSENIWGPCNEMKLQQDTLLYLRASRCTADTRTWERLDFGPFPTPAVAGLISCANFGPLDVGRVKAALHAASHRPGISAVASASICPHLASDGGLGQGITGAGYWHCFLLLFLFYFTASFESLSYVTCASF